jgi:hypothetical protein
MTPEEEAEEAALRAEFEAAGISARDFGFFAREIPEAGIYAPRFDHAAAAPILIRWLPRAQTPLVKERIVRSLTGERAAVPAALRPLIREFRKASLRRRSPASSGRSAMPWQRWPTTRSQTS